MKTILGYADRIGVAPGASIAFKVSSEHDYEAVIVRLINGDTNPAGPGYRETGIGGAHWRLPPRRQAVRPGSCIIVPAAEGLRALAGFTVELRLWPTTPSKPGQSLASLWDAGRRAGFDLRLDGARGLSLTVGDGHEEATVALPAPLLDRCWHAVRASLYPAAGRLALSLVVLASRASLERTLTATADTSVASLGRPAAPLLFAARPASRGDGFEGFFNGKLDSPRMLDGDGNCVGHWDFSIGIDTETVRDVSGHEHHGRTHQMPARAVTGHCWTGEETCWRHAPEQYGAIHFHDDDLADAGWETDFTWTVPSDLRSGLYAARLRSESDEDYIPFVVGPSPATTARLVLIIPTASYQAYANEHLAFDAKLAELVHDHVPVFGPADLHLAAHRELGGSLYDRHSDGSGILFSSRLRPILNMRPKYQSWLGGGTGSGLWQLPADTHLIDFLDHAGIAFDCITDEDLHEQGAAALCPYRCAMTATHAEYWSTAMRDALDGFRDAGGRIMHMGGNGLYWRIAYHARIPGLVEVRRCEVGNGWITPPGESHHAFTGDYGGLWRRIGRPPNESVGVGFAGQGFDRSSHYRRTPASRDPRAAFVFDDVEEEIVGDFGLIGGGAAGIELDRTDPAQGTPPHALILARSEGHTANYLPTVEDLLINYVHQGIVSPIFAELVFFETASGGAVFATGSIAWAGSLSHAGYANAVARITGNVLRRFLDPTPFRMPE